VVVTTESALLVESKEELKAEQLGIKRRPMPEFMRQAMEDRKKAWKQKEARNQVIPESRQRGRQLVYGGKDGSVVVQTV
jgi:hypothetical protein